MKARQQAGFGELSHIAPYGLQGDAETFCQNLDAQAADLANFFDQADLARMELLHPQEI